MTLIEQKEETDKNPKILIFDEFPSFVMFETIRDKKKADKYKEMIATILMMGRSYRYSLWLIMQRPDSQFLPNGARDNFHITISLGRLSKEAKSMLYSDIVLPETHYRVGEGVCNINGKNIKEIVYPYLNKTKEQALEKWLRSYMDKRISKN